MVIKDGCAYGKVNREMINGIKEDIGEIKASIRITQDKITEVSNHYSNRLPGWAVTIITILSSLIVACISYVILRS